MQSQAKVQFGHALLGRLAPDAAWRRSADGGHMSTEIEGFNLMVSRLDEGFEMSVNHADGWPLLRLSTAGKSERAHLQAVLQNLFEQASMAATWPPAAALVEDEQAEIVRLARRLRPRSLEPLHGGRKRLFDLPVRTALSA